MSIECWWPEDRQAVRQRDLHLRKHQLAPVVTRMRVSTNFDSGQSLKCNVRIGSAVDLLGRTLMSTLARGVANKVGCRSMRDSRAKRLDVVPSAEGVMTRLAFACAQETGADVDTLLRKAGLSRTQIEDPQVRITVRSQVVFLDLVAKALGDDLLGFHLAQNFDLRMIGLLYYVLASSETLGEALGRAARYSSIVHEGFRATVREGNEIYVVLESVGVPRRLNRH